MKRGFVGPTMPPYDLLVRVDSFIVFVSVHSSVRNPPTSRQGDRLGATARLLIEGK